MLRVDPKNRVAAALHERLAARVDLDALPSDLCLVVGGDGFMLSCIRELGTSSTFLGLNAGRVGFLLNDGEDFETMVEALTAGAWQVHRFPRLRMVVQPADGTATIEDRAVNDVYLERMSGQTAHLRLEIDGVETVERLVCDGIIASTALGSTAYHFSASGHACHPNVRAIHLTPICPHLPRLAPLTLPADTRITIDVMHPEHRPVRAVTDGVDHGAVTHLEVVRDTEEVALAFLEGHDFTTTLVRKILQV